MNRSASIHQTAQMAAGNQSMPQWRPNERLAQDQASAKVNCEFQIKAPRPLAMKFFETDDAHSPKVNFRLSGRDNGYSA